MVMFKTYHQNIRPEVYNVNKHQTMFQDYKFIDFNLSADNNMGQKVLCSAFHIILNHSQPNSHCHS